MGTDADSVIETPRTRVAAGQAPDMGLQPGPPGEGSSEDAHEVPPPPSGGHAYREKHMQTLGAAEGVAADVLDAAIAVSRPRPRGRSFDAEIDLAEIDERNRPGPTWQARARALSRSNLVVCTRRMCYVGRDVVLAVHLIDDRPIPLYGRVFACEYEGDGMHAVDIDLLELPQESTFETWVRERERSRV